MSSRAISYSLFGYKNPIPGNWSSFEGYLQGFWVNVRLNRILFPGWVTWLNIDQSSYESKYKYLFDWLYEHDLCEINICPDNEKLCKAMLWRLKPMLLDNGPNTDGWRFDAVLCRDTDSPPTYREAQAVEQWLQEDKAIHCITDSISHNIPMMGGMVGFRPKYVTWQRLKLIINRPQPHAVGENKFPESTRWDHLMSHALENFDNKGSDQDFMNRFIYPKCADSATEHFVKGMVHNLPEGNGRHYSIPDIKLEYVDEAFKVTNEMAGHMGAAGRYEPQATQFLKNMDPFSGEYKEIETKDPHFFYWRN